MSRSVLSGVFEAVLVASECFNFLPHVPAVVSGKVFLYSLLILVLGLFDTLPQVAQSPRF